MTGGSPLRVAAILALAVLAGCVSRTVTVPPPPRLICPPLLPDLECREPPVAAPSTLGDLIEGYERMAVDLAECGETLDVWEAAWRRCHEE